MQVDPQDSPPLAVYELMTSLIVPRPIAWVSSCSAEGLSNLAPFSYFMGVSSRPPALAISVARGRGGALKDTARNILETREFTVSLVSQDLAGPMNQSSAPWPADVSEFEALGLASLPGEKVRVPRPALARASMECRLLHALDMGSTHLIVGEVLLFHVDDALVRPGPPLTVDSPALDPLARLGGPWYAGLGPLYSLERPAAPPRERS